MRQASFIDNTVRIHSARFTILLNLSWLFVLPAGCWGLINLFLPTFGAFLTPLQTAALTVLFLILAAGSLACHILGHRSVARLLGLQSPYNLTLFLFGDAAQTWPESGPAWHELAVTVAGPAANLLIAGLAYLLWNAQIDNAINLSMLFLSGFNLWLALINLTPAYPLDGGRLAGLFWPGPGGQRRLIGVRIGYLIAVALTGWGIFLIAQRARFSLETGLTTLSFALLILFGLRIQPAVAVEGAPTGQPASATTGRLIGRLPAGLLILALLASSAALLLTNNALEAPGLALSVEPMVNVPSQYYHSHPGTFILTSVLEQTSITAGEWFLAQLDPTLKIVPPDSLVPANETPQQQSQQDFQMLDQSESTAAVVGLQLAGYPAKEISRGVLVVSVDPASPAKTLLKSGDIITALDGVPVKSTTALIALIRAQPLHASIHLAVERGRQQLQIAVPLMAPAEPGGPPRIGITIDSAGADISLPFPVKITPQKIVGGPSAGLMFTLTVFNALSPHDLTGGRKIAGTGTINPDGTVGPIGGVQQKVAAAEAAGAEYFLSPPDNYADALSAARSIKVVEIATAQQAVNFLSSLPTIPTKSSQAPQ
ncbi:MAG: PDZ domain-containing protein [Anaerolineaceae bacterium]|nr:PDZ domain-containing protein [Anaerolineaceae bacterium]